MKLFLISLCLAYTTTSICAPLPATSSSQIISAYKGLYFSDLGFRISAKNTNWIHNLPSTNTPFILTEYRSPLIENGMQSALSLRSDRLKKRKTLKSYMKKWMRDYPRFGFQILTSKPIKVNQQLGFLIDIYNKQNKRQIRQVVFLKNKIAVTLTCRAHRKNFQKDVKVCNKIIKNFKWTL